MDSVTERNKTCEDRIDSYLASRIQDLEELTARINSEDADDSEEAQEELDNFALALDLRVTMIVQISTGGPGDQLEVGIERDRWGWEGWKLAENFATYRYLDWFDGATRRTDDPAVMAYLSNMVERISPDWAGE